MTADGVQQQEQPQTSGVMRALLNKRSALEEQLRDVQKAIAIFEQNPVVEEFTTLFGRLFG